MPTGEPPPTHVPLRLLVDGFDAARARIDVVAASEPEAFHAVFEALSWVGAVVFRLDEKEVTAPPTVLGLYYVRTLIVHQGADVLAWVASGYGEGAYGEGAYGGTLTRVWRWPPLDELPEPTQPPRRSARCAYVERVAGQDVAEVLARAVQELRALLE